MKLARYFNVSTDYLLGLSPYIQINGENIKMEYSDELLKKKITENISKLNNEGLIRLSDYSQDLVSSKNYEKEVEIENEI